MDREDEGRRRTEGPVGAGRARSLPPFGEVRNNAPVAPRLVSSTNTIAAKNHPLSYGTRTPPKKHRRERGKRGWSDFGTMTPYISFEFSGARCIFFQKLEYNEFSFEEKTRLRASFASPRQVIVHFRPWTTCDFCGR